MVKFTFHDKVSAVEHYLNGHASFTELSKQLGMSKSTLKKWRELYRHHGKEGFLKTCTNNSAEFEMDVLNFMNDTGGSPSDVAAFFSILSATPVR